METLITNILILSTGELNQVVGKEREKLRGYYRHKNGLHQAGNLAD